MREARIAATAFARGDVVMDVWDGVSMGLLVVLFVVRFVVRVLLSL
tara:strand:+ start:155 stop:292 length:138 start_codon:yes stop_codon:yes gene_type:complete